MTITLPNSVQLILDTLHRCGFEAYAVGGCVRDSLLGRTPHDWDVCTSALPEETIRCFPEYKIHTIGIQHGTVLLMVDEHGCEVTTYRTDGEYSDHRRPEQVTFVRSLREDLARRDFTVNAMAWSPSDGLRDLFGGQEDLKNGIIRCVGDPDRRFEEDGLRILRALRFASRYGFSIGPATSAAIRRKAHLLRYIAGERILEELKGFFAGKSAGELMMEYREVFGVIAPEIIPMFDHPQYNPHHCYDIWSHTCHAVMGVREDSLLGFVLWFHDSGKPDCFTRDAEGIGHFHGHPERSAQIAHQVLDRLHCDTASRDTILTLIRWHDRMRIFNRRTVRRMMAELGEERSRLLLRVIRADIMAQNPSMLPEKLAALEEGHRILEELVEEGACLTLKDLAVKGRDLIALGYPAGPELGQMLEFLLNEVLEERVPNKRECLLDCVQQFGIRNSECGINRV